MRPTSRKNLGCGCGTLILLSLIIVVAIVSIFTATLRSTVNQITEHKKESTEITHSSEQTAESELSENYTYETESSVEETDRKTQKYIQFFERYDKFDSTPVSSQQLKCINEYVSSINNKNFNLYSQSISMGKKFMNVYENITDEDSFQALINEFANEYGENFNIEILSTKSIKLDETQTKELQSMLDFIKYSNNEFYYDVNMDLVAVLCKVTTPTKVDYAFMGLCILQEKYGEPTSEYKWGILYNKNENVTERFKGASIF